jgi:hypothetical protein
MKTKIKYIAEAVLWRDRANGNTYHSVRITRTRDGFTICVPMQYGYGDHYKQSTLKMMAQVLWLPVKYRRTDKQYLYERENDYPIYWTKRDGTKQECIAHGQY